MTRDMTNCQTVNVNFKKIPQFLNIILFSIKILHFVWAVADNIKTVELSGQVGFKSRLCNNVNCFQQSVF